MSTTELITIIIVYSFIAVFRSAFCVKRAFEIRSFEEANDFGHRDSRDAALLSLLGVIWPIGLVVILTYVIIDTAKRVPSFVRILRGK